MTICRKILHESKYVCNIYFLEHRNMPVDDAIQLVARNFDAYMRGEKSGGTSTVAIGPAPLANERHPEAIQVIILFVPLHKFCTM